MPARMRAAIASVRRISIKEASRLDGRKPAQFGLREAPGRFAPPATPEPSVPPDGSEPLPPPEAFEPPPPLETPQPSGPVDTAEPLPPLEAFEPPPPLETPEPSGPVDTAEPLPPPDAPEPPPLLETPEPLPPLDAPTRRPHWRRSEEEPPGPGRGIRIAALVMACAVVLLAGSGLGVLLAGWQLELPSLATGTAAPSFEPVAQSEATRAAAAMPEAPPPIPEVTRVERAPVPPVPTLEPAPPAAAATNGMPLPPPPKPAPWSGVAVEDPATTDAVEGALDSLSRETSGSGGPLEPLKDEEASLAEIRVFVHYSASAAGQEAIAKHLTRHLEAEGFAVEAREVDLPIDLDSIRYFLPGDRDEAEALGASLEGQIPGGAAPPVLDFTRYEPKPSPGYLELWIGT